MATSTSKVTVTTTAQTIVSLDNVTQYVHLHSKGATYVGNTNVTTETGFLVDNDDKLVITVPEGCALSAVTTTGSHTLYVLVTRVD
jgi:hypothetical protein